MMNTKTLEWIGVGFSIMGIFLNAWKNIYCWPVWIFSNVFFIYVAIKAKNHPQIVLWIVFSLANVYGWYEWLK